MTTGIQFFPQTLPPNSVVGRISPSAGATESIPLATLAAAMGLQVGNSAGLVSYVSLKSGAVPTNVSAKLQQYVSVVDFGADPTGVADSTTAIQNATQNNTYVYFPAGTYKVTNLVLNNIVNCTWAGAAAGGVGITTTTTGVMVTWNGGGFNVVDGFIFSPTGTLASSTGMVFQGGHNNGEVRRCVFQLWTKIGLQHLGTVGTQLSGNKVYDCYFLQCANASGFGQLDLAYSNDFFCMNNQMGIINTGTYGFPSYGIRANNTSNGSYISNFVWQNLQGMQLSTCGYDRILSNRFEQSQHEGVIANSCTALMFQNNWLNNNGQATLNTYIQARFQACVNYQVHGNNYYDWSGGTNSAKYSQSFESTCTRGSIKNNVCDKYGTAATSFDSSMPATSNSTDLALRSSSGGTIAAGTTTYMLPGGGTTATAGFTLQFPDINHTVVQLIATSNAAPGAGQSFTYTLYKNGSSTGFSVTISGASATQAVANATSALEDTANNAGYQVQVVTSAGAAVTAHQVSVILVSR